MISLSGSIKYKGIKSNLNIQGKLYQSHINSNDILFDVITQPEGNLKVVHWKLYNNPTQDDLVINKKQTNQKTIVLYLFDEDKRDLVGFEFDTSQLNLNGSNYELSSSVSDAWYYKVMEGTPSTPDVSIALDAPLKSISTFVAYTDPYNNGCDETHWKQGQFGFSYPSSTLKSGNVIAASIKVTNQYIAKACYPNGRSAPPTRSTINADSAVWWGNYSDPVALRYTFSGSNTNGGSTVYRDYIFETKWFGGDLTKASSSLPKIGLEVGYGPISVGYEYSKTFEVGDTYTRVYFSDGKYSYTQRMDFKNTRLYKTGSYYATDAVMYVSQGHGSPYQKNIKVNIWIPVYGNGAGLTSYGGQNYETSVNYHSSL